MKYLKVTSVVLTVAMCMSMIAPVSVLADETAAPAETQTEETVKPETKETEKKAPKETEKPKETEIPKPSETEKKTEETEKQDPVETTKKEPAETEKQEPAETQKTAETETQEPAETQKPAETEKQEEPAETEKQEPETTESQVPSESEEQAPEVTEQPVQETEAKKDAKDAGGSCGDSATWTLSNGVLTISGSGKVSSKPWDSDRNSITSLVIKEGITATRTYLFENCKNLKSISLPASFEDIGSYSFHNCTSLTEVTIPAGVYEIGTGAFAGCSKLKKVNLECNLWKIGSAVFQNCSSLTTINIPDQVSLIDYWAFEGCTSLTKITLPSTVYTIEDGSFKDCTSLTTINIPEGVSNISDEVFYGCTGLTSVTLPSTVIRIGNNAFENCTNLESITIPAGIENIWVAAFNGCSSLADVYYGGTEAQWNNINIAADNGPLHNAELHSAGSSFAGASGTCGTRLEWVLDTDGVLTISGSGAMSSYDISDNKAPWTDYKGRIKKVVIGSGATSIGSYAFYGCSHLKNITIPGTVTSIGTSAFYGCALTGVSIPSSVTSIGNGAFESCDALATVTLTSGLLTIGDNAFHASGVKSVTIPGTVTSIGESAFSECKNLTSAVVSQGVKKIGNYAFKDSASLTSLTIPEGVTEIGSMVIMGSAVTELTVPSTVTTCGYFVFGNCSTLKTVTIADGVSSITGNAFSGCSSLKTITIPLSVTSIGSYAFSGCSSLTDVYYDGTQSNWNAISVNSYGNEQLKSATIHYGSSGVTKYRVTLGKCNNGTATFTPSTAAEGETVTVNVTPNTGYSFNRIDVDGTMYYTKTFKMPAKNVTVDVYFTQVQYTISVRYSAGGTASCYLSKAGTGDLITVNTNPDDGYEVDSITVNGTEVSNPFTMPAGNAEVYVTFAKAGYPLTLKVGDNGTASLNKYTANKGSKITVTAEPDKGYTLDTIKVNGTAITGTEFTMGSSATTVEVSFKKATYNVSVSVPNGGGTASASATAVYGSTVSVTCTPSDGYEFDKMTVNGSAVSGKTFTMPAGNASVVVSFKKINYTITVKTDSNGTAKVSKNPANVGDVITVTATPATGYTVDTIKVNGKALASGVKTFTMTAQTTTVEVTFKAGQYTITVSVPDGGGTASASSTKASRGDSVTISTTPATGYEVDTIKVNGTAISGDTFTMPAQDTEVVVSFKKSVYKITLASVSNGKASVSKTTAYYGDKITVTATPATGYTLDEIRVNETELSGTTFTMGAGDVTVTVKFKKVQYAITASVYGEGGTVTTDPVKAGVGDTVTVIATPSRGYSVKSIVVNNKAITGDTFTMTAQATTVVVTFTKASYKITVSATTNGSATVSQDYANYGDKITVTATPAAGYALDTIKVNGTAITGTTFTMGDTDTTVAVTFKKVQYAVTVSAGTGGTASASPVKAYYGDTVTVTTTPSRGYEFDYIEVNGLAIEGDTFTMPAAAATVKVFFKKSIYKITVSPTTNGSATVPSATASYGDKITVTATPATGYTLNTIKVNGTAITGTTFTMSDKDTTVEVTFKKVQYAITASVDGEGGTVTTNPAKAGIGDTVTVIATPSRGYSVKSIVVNNKAISGDTFTMTAQATTVVVTFSKASYKITVSETTNGSAKVSQNYANYGDKITVTATPATGYALNTIKVNGTAITGTTFTMSDKDTTVEVTFKKVQYAVTVSAGTGGTASASPAKAYYGDTVTVTATPSRGYELDYIEVNGLAIEGNTFSMPAAAATVKVFFKKSVYKLTVSPTTNGSATVPSSTACYGDKITVTATPATGYALNTIKVNGTAITGTTFTMSDKDTTVEVTFKKVQYTVTVKYTTGGTASADLTKAGYGDMVSLTCKPNTGYEVDTITVNGENSEEAFIMPAENVTVVVSFKKTDYEITVGKVSHGKATVSKNPANYGDKITVDVTPDTGYTLDVINVNGNPIKGNTFTMEARWTTVEVYLKLQDYKVTVKTSEGGTASVDKTVAHMGETVKVTTEAEPGYTLDKIIVNGYASTSSFLMGAADAEVVVTFKKIEYSISLTVGANGTAKLSQIKGVIGDVITVETTPAENYYAIIKVNGDVIVGNTFNMPPMKVTVNVTFDKVKQLDVGETAKVGNGEYQVLTAAPENGTGAVMLTKYEDDGVTKSVVVPGTVDIMGFTYRVISIGNNAFAGNATMTVLNVGPYVTVIGSKACYGCKALVKVSGGLRLKTIGNMAFGACPKLSTFVITSAVLAKISPYTFYADKSLKTIYVNKTTKLSKKGVKKSLKSSSVKTVKVKKSKVKKYKKFFTKKNCGRKVKVKK